jgi:cyclopropane-fatty-acyl-phospholipid synthase
MSTQRQVDKTYNYIDEIWRLSLGSNADITCALYDGDYSKTLEEAQAAKHMYILKSIKFKPGVKILDIGCGWGPLLKAIHDAG